MKRSTTHTEFQQSNAKTEANTNTFSGAKEKENSETHQNIKHPLNHIFKWKSEHCVTQKHTGTYLCLFFSGCTVIGNLF